MMFMTMDWAELEYKRCESREHADTDQSDECVLRAREHIVMRNSNIVADTYDLWYTLPLPIDPTNSRTNRSRESLDTLFLVL